MRAILLDDGVDELLGGGPATEQTHTPRELGHERQGVAHQVLPLDGCVPHLPTRKLPETGGQNERDGEWWSSSGKRRGEERRVERGVTGVVPPVRKASGRACWRRAIYRRVSE